MFKSEKNRYLFPKPYFYGWSKIAGNSYIERDIEGGTGYKKGMRILCPYTDRELAGAEIHRTNFFDYTIVLVPSPVSYDPVNHLGVVRAKAYKKNDNIRPQNGRSGWDCVRVDLAKDNLTLDEIVHMAKKYIVEEIVPDNPKFEYVGVKEAAQIFDLATKDKVNLFYKNENEYEMILSSDELVSCIAKGDCIYREVIIEL